MEIKNLNLILSITVVTAVIFLLVFINKSNITAAQMKQDVFHFMAGQETRLKTVQFEEFSEEHFQIKYLKDDEEYVEMIAETAEEAYVDVCNMMETEPSQKTTLVVYPDSQSLAESFGWDKDEQAMGVYWGGTIRILSPGQWLDKGQSQEVFKKDGPLTHEFTHLIVDEITKGNYKRWWTEGIAQYAEKKINGFEFADPFAGTKEKDYFTIRELEKSFNDLDQRIAYWESLKAVEYIVNEYGEDTVYEILDYLGKGYSMEKATEKSLCTDFSTFEYDFYQYLENM